MALVSLAAVLVISALLGLGIYLLLKKLRRRWLRLLISAFSAVVVLCVVGIVLFVVGLTPATNEPVGSTARITMDMGNSLRAAKTPGASSNRGTGVRPPPREQARTSEEVRVLQTIVIFFKDSVKPQEDFTFLVSVSSPEGSLPTGKHLAILSAPPSAKIRTSDECDERGSPNGGMRACAGSDGKSFRAAWDVTTTDSGTLLFTLTLPDTLGISPNPGDQKWLAEVRGTGMPGPSSGGWPGYVLLKPEQPYTEWGGRSVDLAKRQIRIPIQVVTTLGLTRHTFTTLAYMGACLSAVLGSGWIWHLLVWLREKRIGPVVLKP